MSVWIYTRLKRPFTLADLLFYPNEECIKKNTWSDIDDVHFTSVIRWIPGINLMTCAVLLFMMFVTCFVTTLEWLYNNTIKKIFGKIIFK